MTLREDYLSIEVRPAKETLKKAENAPHEGLSPHSPDEVAILSTLKTIFD